MNTVKLSDVHLAVINAALETYFRLKTGQVAIALDIAYDYKLNYKQTQSIEDQIKTLVYPKIASRGTSYGVGSPEIGDATIAYEIRKTFEEYVAVKNNNGYYGHTVDFDGPVKISDVPLPIIVDHKNYKDFILNKRESKKVNKLLNEKDYEGAWKYIDSLKKGIPRGEKTEIIPSFVGVIVRVTKPRNNKDLLINE